MVAQKQYRVEFRHKKKFNVKDVVAVTAAEASKKVIEEFKRVRIISVTVLE